MGNIDKFFAGDNKKNDRRKNMTLTQALDKSPSLKGKIPVSIVPEHGKPFTIYVDRKSQVEPARKKMLKALARGRSKEQEHKIVV